MPTSNLTFPLSPANAPKNRALVDLDGFIWLRTAKGWLRFSLTEWGLRQPDGPEGRVAFRIATPTDITEGAPKWLGKIKGLEQKAQGKPKTSYKEEE